jgi:integrase
LTRYPKQGKGRRWTVAELKAIQADWKSDTLSDGDGLSGEVRVALDGAVSVRWKYAFKCEGKVNWFQPGTWPTVSLDEIRTRRDNARRLLQEGINPNAYKVAASIEAQRQVAAVVREEAERIAADATVQDLFDEWVQHGVKRGDSNTSLRRSFEKDVLPQIGSTAVRLLTEAQLRDVLLLLVGRGVNRTAQLTCTNIQQMFRWAEKRKPWRQLLAEGNPADLLEIGKIVSEDYDLGNVRTRVVSEDELQELLQRFAETREAYEAAPPGDKYNFPRPLKRESELAVWICLSTLSRIGETLKAEWEHVNIEARTWFIPAENTKGQARKRRAITIHLSDFAVRQFEALKARTGHTKWLFPSRDTKNHVDEKSVTKQIGDRQILFKQRPKGLKNRRDDDTLVIGGGKNGEWTPHDMRRTGATMMQALGVLPDVIDRCQNHFVSASKVRRAYQQHDYAAEMKDAWERLGRRLDDLVISA